MQKQQESAAAAVAAKVVSDAAYAAAKVSSESATNATVTVDIAYIRRDIGELKTAVRELGGQFPTKAEFVELVKSGADREVRIRSLEQNQWKAIGMASVVSAVLSIVIAYLLKFV